MKRRFKKLKRRFIKTPSFHIYIPSFFKKVKSFFNSCIYIVSKKNTPTPSSNQTIYSENQNPIMTLLSLKKLESFLPESMFLRVHRSYIVNLNKISVIERNRIVFDQKTYIPISEQYKAKFQEYLSKNFLS